MYANSAFTFAEKFIKRFIKHDVIGTAAQTAFFLTLSIPPVLVLSISVSLRLGSEEAFHAIFEYIFPQNISAIFDSVVDALPKSASATAISALGVIFSASGSTWALMRGIHKASMRQKLRYTLKNRLLATVVMAVFVLSIMISLGVLIAWGVLSAYITTIAGAEILFSLSNRVLAVGFIFFLVFFLYRFTPNMALRGKELFWGALFSALGWFFASMLFGVYIQQFTKYTTVYGGIGAFFILMLWLYIISFIILTGAHINGTISELSPSPK